MDGGSLNALGAVALGIGDGLTSAMTGATGLGPACTAALATVLARPGTSVADLGTTLGVTHSGAVRVVARLKSAGLVLRGPGRNGRTAGLQLTHQGHALVGEALAARERFLGDLVEVVHPGDAAALRRVIVALGGRLPMTVGEARRVCRLCAHEVCRGLDCPVGCAFVPAAEREAEEGSAAR